MSGNVVVTGVGVTTFGREPGRTVRSMAEEAAAAAMKDAGLVPDDIDAVLFSNSTAGIITGQESIRGQAALRNTGLLGKPFFNVENACASGSSAVLLGRAGILAGSWRRVLAVGSEKMTHDDRTKTYQALAAAMDVSELEDRAAATVQGGDSSGGSGGSFMDAYARATRAYMDKTGATQEDIAGIVVKNRHHAAHNPVAQYREEVTIEDVLASGDIAWPLTRFMCSPIGDGAAAAVLELDEGRLEGPAIEMLASVVYSGDPNGGEGEMGRSAQLAYELAGVGPEDVDVAEVHDAAAPAELWYYELLGFCAAGDGPRLVRDGDVRVGGRIPVNTSGGLVCRGHPIGATGIAQIAEIVHQLRGTATGRQVTDARVGLVQNAGGLVGSSQAASAVTILRRR